MPRRNCLAPNKCEASGRGGPCRLCDAAAIAQRAVMLRERIAANRAEGRPRYAERPAGSLREHQKDAPSEEGALQEMVRGLRNELRRP